MNTVTPDVVVYHNVNAFTHNPNAQPEYRRVFGFDTLHIGEWVDADTDPHNYAERCFALFNGAPGTEGHPMAEAYYAQGNRSLSVSDIVVVAGHVMRCDQFGFTELDAMPEGATEGAA